MALRLTHQPFRAVQTSRRCSRRTVVAPVAALKLYAHPRTRSKIIEWYLKETGTPYEAVPISLEEKEHKGEEFLKVNPFGKLPALEDDGLKLFESGALLLYLADKYGEASTPEQRGEAAQWVLFANTTLGNAVFLEQFRETQMPPVMDALNGILEGRDYLTGAEFTVADVAVGSYLLYIPLFFPTLDLSPWPAVQKYMDRLKGREHCTIGKA